MFEIEKRFAETKNDVGKQMHEMCSMVEELAQMSKGIEFQLNKKQPEIEGASLNIANLQRKMDEAQRNQENELNIIKKR